MKNAKPKRSILNNSAVLILAILVLGLLASCRQDQQHQKKMGNKTAKENLPTFLIYGELMPVGYTEEQDSVATKKFGFNIKRVADCEVTSELIDSVKKINIENNIIMKSKYGNDWKYKFEKQCKLKLAIPEI